MNSKEWFFFKILTLSKYFSLESETSSASKMAKKLYFFDTAVKKKKISKKNGKNSKKTLENTKNNINT
jgi:hypothetical protein